MLITRARADGDLARLALHLGNRGAVLREMGRSEQANACFTEEESLCGKMGDALGQSVAIGHLAQLEYDRGDIAEALAKFEEQIVRFRQSAAACHAARIGLKKLSHSISKKKALSAARRSASLQVCLGNQVRLLQRSARLTRSRAQPKPWPANSVIPQRRRRPCCSFRGSTTLSMPPIFTMRFLITQIAPPRSLRNTNSCNLRARLSDGVRFSVSDHGPLSRSAASLGVTKQTSSAFPAG